MVTQTTNERKCKYIASIIHVPLQLDMNGMLAARNNTTPPILVMDLVNVNTHTPAKANENEDLSHQRVIPVYRRFPED
jgi:hypothetical protein